MAVTRNEQTARQCHLYRGIFPVFYNQPAHDVWAEDVDMRVNFAMEMGQFAHRTAILKLYFFNFFLFCVLVCYFLCIHVCRLSGVVIPGKARGFFKTNDAVIILTGWRPGSGYTNTMRVVLVP